MSANLKWFKIIAAIVMLSLVISGFGASYVAARPSSADDSKNLTLADRPIGKDAKGAIDPDQKVRMIVRLTDAPLASYRGGVADMMATSPKATGKSRLDLASPASVAYDQYLQQKQAEFVNNLNAALPGSRVDHSYRVVLNALTVTVRYGDLPALRELPDVAGVYLEKEYKMDMDASLPLVGLGTGTIGDAWTDAGLWDAVGGHANAGAGIKIADIDSGITPENPCFDPTGFTYPDGFPKGEIAYTNEKIIAARAYFRADDPPFYPATPLDDPADVQGGHGTHTAGTMTCAYGTDLGYTKISGVAPKAQLMVYRVFYRSVAGSNSAWTPEILAALEDALLDGADMINNSWGGGNYNSVDDPEVLAFEAAVDAGVVIVFSAGNSGSAAFTIGNPGGNSDKFITVANSYNSRMYANAVSVESPSGATPPLDTGVIAYPGSNTSITESFTDTIKYDATNPLGCSAFSDSNFFDGHIALVQRGTCNFTVKVLNAYNAGASFLVMYNSSTGSWPVSMATDGMPIGSVIIDYTNGTNLMNFVVANPDAVVKIHASKLFPLTPDTLSSSSSRGPTPDMLLKPDISAPGSYILSSVSGPTYGDHSISFDQYSGTSMAAPHVTGASALLLQLHPDWTPAQIKSALMSVAVEPAALGDIPTNRGSGRLNLDNPHLVGATFDMPSLSYALLTTSDPAKVLTVGAYDEIGADTVYTLTVAMVGGAANVVTTSVPTITVPADGMAQFDVTMTPTDIGASYGKVTLTPPAGSGLPELHIPYYGTVIDGIPVADVLLIDDDYSDDYASCPNYVDVYTNTLQTLGYSYTLYPGGYYGFPADTWYQARRHSMILYFSGECGDNLSFYSTSLRNYMAQGGKLLIMGQDIGWVKNYYAVNYGTAYDWQPPVWVGGEYALDDVFNGVSELVAGGMGDYSPFMAGTSYWLDLATTYSVDEIAPAFFSDVDTLPILGNPGLPGTVAGGHMGTRLSYEPTIERMKGEQPAWNVPYRGMWVSFGLENVDYSYDGASWLPTPEDAQADLLWRLLSWMEDDVAVAPAAPKFITGQPDIAATLAAYGATTGGPGNILRYRWDFGDGSPIVSAAPNATTPGTAVISHKYPATGMYLGYVEITDIFGHKAVEPFVVQVGNLLWAPFVTFTP